MKSILIVEDDITYGMILKTWLGKKGFLVSSASSIARAQKHIEAETVDLILSDLRLPDRDGIDLLKWLGEHSLHPSYHHDGLCRHTVCRASHETGRMRLHCKTRKPRRVIEENG